jgi:hypothetical protein
MTKLRAEQWKRLYLKKNAKPTLPLTRKPSAIDKSAGENNGRTGNRFRSH